MSATPICPVRFTTRARSQFIVHVRDRSCRTWAKPTGFSCCTGTKERRSIRFCADYRRLNAVTQFDAYPLPRIDKTFKALSGSRYFTTLDLLSGYWQVGLTIAARIKSAFTVRGGLYLWNVIPFELCNALWTFERLMESVLQGLL